MGRQQGLWDGAKLKGRGRDRANATGEMWGGVGCGGDLAGSKLSDQLGVRICSRPQDERLGPHLDPSPLE